jgi:hypothetical protein
MTFYYAHWKNTSQLIALQVNLINVTQEDGPPNRKINKIKRKPTLENWTKLYRLLFFECRPRLKQGFPFWGRVDKDKYRLKRLYCKST